MLAAGTTLGNYQIHSLLGAGGMGEVYRARDPRLERDIALKVLPDLFTADATARARLIREARAAAALSHPNICHVYEVGEAAGHVYIAMELVEGQPLSQRIGGRPLPVESVVRYGVQIADALAHAHERHVIHRDLKSGNVMVTPEGRAKVLDLGLAKRLWEVDEQGPTQPQVTLTETGAVVGTPHYLAPEVLSGAKADAVSDVWALGVVLYEMASGTLPFRGGTTYELSAAILNETPAPLPERVPAGLRAVITRCLEKQPGERSQRAGEVRAALEAVGVAATPAGPTPGAPRRPRTRMAIVLLPIAVAVLAAAAAAWITRDGWLPRPRLHEVQLTNRSWEMSVSHAELSPDGRMLLYDDWSGLHLMDLTTRESQDVALPAPLRGQTISYSWRPDSRTFVIGPNHLESNAGLWEMSVFSRKAEEIRATGSVPKVSPDGKSMAFVTTGGNRKDMVWVADAAGTGAHKLADVTTFWNMGWSPDSKRLAVVEGAISGLTILEAQSGRRWRALEEPRLDWSSDDVGIAWMETGRLIISMPDSTNTRTTMNLYEIRLDAHGARAVGTPRRLTDWRDDTVYDLTLTSDHRRLALLRGWAQLDVYWADLSPSDKRLGELKRLTLDSGDKYPAGWAPTSDGLFFGYSDGRTYRQQLDGPTAESVDERYRYLIARWDGGRWLYALRSSRRGEFAGSTYQLTRTPVGGGATDILKEWKPTAHADSAGWYLGFDLPPVEGVAGVVYQWEDSVFVIWRLDPVAGALSEIMRLGHRPAYFGNALSRDGERLALCASLATIDLLDLRAKRLSTLRPRLTGAAGAADSLKVQSAVWLPKDDALIVSAPRPGGLWWLELDGRATRLYASRDFTNPFVGTPQMSPDGRKIAVSMFTGQTNTWLIDGLK